MKKILKNIAYGAVGLALFGGIYLGLPSENLKPRDFDNANWSKFYNENGRIWSCYANENIPQNSSNWNLYTDKVRKRNNNNLEGTIMLPDLDSDGRVGK